MKFKLILLFIFSTALMTANAQKKFGVGAYAGTSIPTGSFNDYYNPGTSAAISFNYGFKQNVQISIKTGYINWGFDNSSYNDAFIKAGGSGKFNLDVATNAVPLIVNAKYFLGNKIVRPYILISAGVYFLKQEVKGNYTNNNGNKIDLGDDTYSSNETQLGIGAGILIPISKNLFIDANALYGVINDSQVISDASSNDSLSATNISKRTVNVVNVNAGLNYYF